jgi:hypothetical protein
MRLAIMQPYFMPYIGYFQLINSVDEFVVYDNIEFTKKGWINRNRILANGRDLTITVPLKKDSDYLNIVERKLADIWISERKKMLNRIIELYRKATYFKVAFPVVEQCILFEGENLFDFIYSSIRRVNEYLDINTKILIASTLLMDHSLSAEKKVIAICKTLKAGNYINPIGGLELYSKEVFKQEGIDLQFLKPDQISYKQFQNEFVPWLSIIDVIMFNSKDEIKQMLNLYSLQ